MTFKLFNITIRIKKEILAIFAILMLFLLALIGFLINKNEVVIYTTKDSEKDLNNSVIKDIDIKESTEKDENIAKTEKIKVYIIGCVKNPGIITLNKGQMIHDAIVAAGGITEEADLENINMVYRLEENVMLNILSKEKNQKIEERDILINSNTQSGVKIIRDEGSSVLYVSETRDKDNMFDNLSLNRKININTASTRELEILPGIGDATASNIIKYREEHGNFNKIEDIMNVSGIKENRFEKIKEYIKVK
jgi:competence protein ComEA